jgi:hypothetical protein
MRCQHQGGRNTVLTMSCTTAPSALRTHAYGVDAPRHAVAAAPRRAAAAAVVAGTFTRMTWHVNAGVMAAAEASRLAAATKQIEFSVPRSSPPA